MIKIPKDRTPTAPDEWSEELQCFWAMWVVCGPGELVLHVNGSTDMCGAIRAAKKISPDVRCVYVYSYGQPDICYVARPTGDWPDTTKRTLVEDFNSDGAPNNSGVSWLACDPVAT